MDADRWRRLSPLLDALLELDPATRERSLASMREDDPALGEELAALLTLDDEHGDFLAEPLVAPLPGPRSGTLVGPYRLERLIGEGGMGQVWLAGRADGLYQRRVALKLLRPGLADPNLQMRFVRERQILARLAHPHIARLLDAGISGDGQPYLALEYVEGEPVTEWCHQRNLSLDARLRLFLQVCDAVSHAHANLIVHRDLKPSNIMVTAQEEVQLLDFGIAKLLDTTEMPLDHTGTGTGLRAFTLHYAAPEQVRGEPVTTMTDVYALGVVLHELLTGSRPYELKRRTDAEWEEAIVSGEPTRPSQALQRAEPEDEPAREKALRQRLARVLAGDLDNIVLKALAKRPEQRYPSVEALALDIGRYRAGKPVLARSQSMGYRMRKYASRHRWMLASALLVAAVLSVSFVLVAWQARQAVREASRAQALQDFVIGLFERAGAADGKAPLDVRTLLDAGLARGDRELAHQPVARAELTGVVARMRLGMGDYRPALALLDEQARLVAALGDDAPSSLRLESATERGRARLALGDEDACEAALDPLLALAQREQRQLPVQVADYWSQLGRCRRAEGHADVARSLFQRALALRRDVIGDATGSVQSLADLAGLHADAGQYARARDDYRAALRQLRGTVGARHPLAVMLLRELCLVQRSLGDTVGAERDCGSALALSSELHGEGHPATVDSRRAFASMQIEIGRYSEAEAALRSTRAWTLSHVGASNAQVADDDDGLARIAWERGQAGEALARLDDGLAAIDLHRDSPKVAELLSHKAIVLHGTARDREARPLLESARRIRVAAFDEADPRVGEIDSLLGQVDARLGKDALALPELRAGERVLGAALGPSHPQALRARLALLRYQAARGDPDALAGLDTLAAVRAPREIGVRKVAWLAAASAASMRCHGPDRERARSTLRVVAAEVRNAQPEGGAASREIAALDASCG